MTCPKEISEILSEQYSSAFSRPAYDSAEINNLFKDKDTIPNELSDIDFGEDLIGAMDEFPSNSAAKTDGFFMKGTISGMQYVWDTVILFSFLWCFSPSRYCAT